jgi:hypothetical protein
LLPDDGRARPKPVAKDDILNLKCNYVTIKRKVLFPYIYESDLVNGILMQQDAEI